jgi:nucleoside-diphosphate-sugar epimerase
VKVFITGGKGFVGTYLAGRFHLQPLDTTVKWDAVLIL